MQMFKRSVSILLAVLIVCSVFTAVPLSVSASDKRVAKVGAYDDQPEAWREGYDAGYQDKIDSELGDGTSSNPNPYSEVDNPDNYNLYEEGYQAGEAAAQCYVDGYNDGYGDGHNEYNGNENDGSNNTYDPETESEYYSLYEDGYSEGYNAGYADAESEAVNYYQEGYDAGYSAGLSDYPDGNTDCVNPYEDDVNGTYDSGWSDGYSAGWAEAMANEPVYTYDDGYGEGEAAAQEDYNNGYYDSYGNTSCPSDRGENYENGWSAGYDQRWYALRYDSANGWSDGVDAADYDFREGLGRGNSSPPSEAESYTEYIDQWNAGYDFEWNEIEYFNDDDSYISYTTDNDAIYLYKPAKGELIFVSGEFRGDFFTSEFEKHYGSNAPLFKISTAAPEDIPELSGRDLPGVSFAGDCTYMFSNAHTRTRCTAIMLENVDTSAVTSFAGMFYNCDDLVHLDISSFTFDSMTYAEIEGYKVPGDFGMFGNSTDLYCLVAPSDLDITAEMMLYVPNRKELKGWVNCEGDGKVVSDEDTLTIPGGTVEVSVIPAADTGSSDPVLYVVKSVEEEWDWFAGHSLTLGGDIGVNFFIDLPVSYSAVYLDFLKLFTVTFEYDDSVVTVPFSIDMIETVDGNRYFKVPCRVPAAEMTSNIHAYITYAGYDTSDWVYDDYSVRQYGDVILDANSDFSVKYVNENDSDKYDDLCDLVKKMLDYGTKAQVVFNRTDLRLANDGIDYNMTEITADTITSKKSSMKDGLADLGLEYQGTTVVFLSDTTLRHYYSITNQAAFDAVKNTANFTYKDDKLYAGVIYFEKTGIPAAELDEVQSFEIGDKTYNYSVLDYSRGVLKSSAMTPAEKQLAMATYWFNDAANKFFGA